MRIFVTFPKEGFYSQKSNEMKRTLNETFKEYFRMITGLHVPFTYPLEDAIAYGLVQALPDEDKGYAIPITFIHESDAKFMVQQSPMALPEYFLSEYTRAKQELGDSCTRYTVDPKLAITDKEKYIKTRQDIYYKRRRHAADAYIDTCDTVLMFRADSNMDNYRPVSVSAKAGDGRLLIEVHPMTNAVASYYGGVYLEKNMLPSVLEVQKG